MEDDWDLHAVVRGCAALSAAAVAPSTTAATTSAAARSSQAPNTNQLDCSLPASCFEDLFEPRRNSFFPEELHDLYRPFFPKPLPPLSTPLFSLDPPPPPPSPPPQIVKQLAQQTTQLRQKQPAFSVSNGSKTSASHNPSPRSKRRKSLTKKICHVSAENLSSDVWSWRKYGQKPIKGSPYPRGYYKCSTSKGCMARKQVERNRSDPGMFIVTYTAEHNHPMPTHRNSLAGSTRQKPADPPTKPSSSSPELSPAPSLSPAPEKLESSREEDLAEAEDEDDEFSVSKMALDDDFFDGLEDFAAAPDAGDFASGHLPGTLPFPWLPATATTTAGGG